MEECVAETDDSYRPPRRVCAAKETPGPSGCKAREKLVVEAQQLKTEMFNFQNKFPLHTQILKGCRLVAAQSNQITKVKTNARKRQQDGNV